MKQFSEKIIYLIGMTMYANKMNIHRHGYNAVEPKKIHNEISTIDKIGYVT